MILKINIQTEMILLFVPYADLRRLGLPTNRTTPHLLPYVLNLPEGYSGPYAYENDEKHRRQIFYLIRNNVG